MGSFSFTYHGIYQIFVIALGSFVHWSTNSLDVRLLIKKVRNSDYFLNQKKIEW